MLHYFKECTGSIYNSVVGMYNYGTGSIYNSEVGMYNYGDDNSGLYTVQEWRWWRG